MSDIEQLIQRFDKIATYKNGDRRAPHKPLLLLLALNDCISGNSRLRSFSEIENKLKSLLREFGNQRAENNIHCPFWRLKNDGIWEIENHENVRITNSGDPFISDLREYNVQAGLSSSIFDYLKNRPAKVKALVNSILLSHFNETQFEDILETVGFDFSVPLKKQKRDPAFREKVLYLYKHSCALCGLGITLNDKTICIEAAHIKWFNHEGPCIPTNGIALCTLHHKLFDRGAFTIIPDSYRIKVSDRVSGPGREEWLTKFNDKKIWLPNQDNLRPSSNFIKWHVKEVYQDYEF
jgi:putative restriction endonuclease